MKARPLSVRGKAAVSAIALVAVVFADQLIKYAVKTGFCLHESREVTSWMYILFVENSGMAFGMSFVGTVFLTAIRLVLVALLSFYLRRIVLRGFPCGYIVCVSMILAGALGNIIDNSFYGMIYSESSESSVAELVPFGEGYGSFLSGKVVDMFYFPIVQADLPRWVPFWGGGRFVFFSPVFNFADASITCGAAAVLLFYRRLLSPAGGASRGGKGGRAVPPAA